MTEQTRGEISCNCCREYTSEFQELKESFISNVCNVQLFLSPCKQKGLLSFFSAFVIFQPLFTHSNKNHFEKRKKYELEISIRNIIFKWLITLIFCKIIQLSQNGDDLFKREEIGIDQR